MNIIFVGVFYYGGPVRYLYRIFEIYKALGKVFKTIGINVKYFVKQSEVLPLQDTLTEKQFEEMLSECDLLFMWNGGLGKEKEISEKCQKQGVPVYYTELGWLPQTGTFYFDRKGVNYESSIRDWEHMPISIEQKEELRIKLAYYHNLLAKSTGIAIHEKDFVFVPFQVEADSQIINYSKRIKKMQQLVDYVCAFVPERIIFKMHPKDNPGEIKLPVRCKLYRTGTTHDFLPNCKYVVTINSTVGVEALSYNKPVVNLGDAFYESRKMTYKVTNDEEFKNAIKWANEGKVAVGVIESFLGYLFKRQWYSADLNNPKKILKLIEDITERRL